METSRQRAVRIFLAVLAVLGTGTAACGTILGDVPDGHLTDTPDAGAPGDANVPKALPDGTIGSTTNATILDMAVDDTDVFWLSVGRRDGGRVFAIEACPKNGSSPARTMTTLNVEPKALALSNDYVLWSVDRAQNDSGGVWRIRKEGGTPPSTPWVPLEHAGPLAYAADSGRIHIGMANGGIEVYVPDGDGGRAWGLAPPPFNPGAVSSMVVSDTTVYWSRLGPNDILTIPSHVQQVLQPDPFAGASSSAPSFLASDNGTLYWAVPGTSDVTLYSQRTANAQAVAVTTAIGGFADLAVRNGIYWTTNDGGKAAVWHCAPNPTCTAERLWEGDASVSRIAVDDTDVYFAVGVGADTHILKHAK